MTRTNCPNCGAVIDIHDEKCAYCDTPYEWAVESRVNVSSEPTYTVNMDLNTLSKAMSACALTANEASEAFSRMARVVVRGVV